MCKYSIPERGLNAVRQILNNKLSELGTDWREGIKWTSVLENLEKHLSSMKLGEDYDENGILNIAHVASDALILAEYYATYPQGDDRKLGVQTRPVICCDLDDVIFSFTEAYEARYGKMSEYWNGDYKMLDNLAELQKDEDFWVNMPLKNRPTFEVAAYVTAREIPVEWTMKAIEKHNLPKAKVVTLPWNVSKIDTLKELGCTIMLDDKYETMKECEANGIFCYLLSTKSNQYYNVGHRRIKDLNLNLM